MMRLHVLCLACAAALPGCSEAAVDPASRANAAEGAIVETIDARALAQLVQSNKVQLIDVRSAAEFADGHIQGAVNLPVESFDAAAIKPVEGKQTILYCRSGRRSERAARMLAQKDGNATHLEGGILAWQEAGQAVVN